MGLVPPDDGLPRAAARARRRQRRAADLRRGDHRLPRRARRRAGAHRRACPTSRSWARSSAAACRPPPSAARATLMERIAPAGDVYQAGTLSGNPLAVAAGLATLRAARRRRLRARSRRRRERSPRACARRRRRGVPGAASSAAPGPADRVLRAEPRRATTPSAQALRPRRLRAPGAAALLARGVYPPPSQFEAWFPSLAHTPSTSSARSRPPRRPSRRSRERARAPAPTLSREGGLLAAAARRPPDATLGASRRRPAPAAARPYALLVEAIREGYLLHYGARAARPRRPDLALLAGRPPLRARPRARWPRSATSRRSASSPT